MRKKIIWLLIIIASLVASYFLKNLMLLIILIAYLGCDLFLQKIAKNRNNLNKTAIKKVQFLNYIKSTILLSYSSPIKVAFSEVDINDYPEIQIEINDFLSALKYDYTQTPFAEFALKINNVKFGINYELNIMNLIYEVNKNGLGKDYITEIINEIDLIANNNFELRVEQIKNQGYQYAVIPTVVNFFYLSIVLFKIIDFMMIAVMS